jgi:uncharacterized protein with PIN domain
MTGPRFLLDGMLGRLCRKLRMLGFDCELTGEGRSPWLLKDAEKSGRTAVTTATRSLDRRGPPPVVLRNGRDPEMIAELFTTISVDPRPAPFTLCLECNTVLEKISPEEAAAHVPPRISRDFKEFHRCTACGRIYWKGSHYEAMVGQVDAVMRRLRGEGELER